MKIGFHGAITIRALLASKVNSPIHRNNLGLYSRMFKISMTGMLPFHSRSASIIEAGSFLTLPHTSKVCFTNLLRDAAINPTTLLDAL